MLNLGVPGARFSFQLMCCLPVRCAKLPQPLPMLIPAGCISHSSIDIGIHMHEPTQRYAPLRAGKRTTCWPPVKATRNLICTLLLAVLPPILRCPLTVCGSPHGSDASFHATDTEVVTQGQRLGRSFY